MDKVVNIHRDKSNFIAEAMGKFSAKLFIIIKIIYPGTRVKERPMGMKIKTYTTVYHTHI